jgi:hypothetical protein
MRRYLSDDILVTVKRPGPSCEYLRQRLPTCFHLGLTCKPADHGALDGTIHLMQRHVRLQADLGRWGGWVGGHGKWLIGVSGLGYIYVEQQRVKYLRRMYMNDKESIEGYLCKRGVDDICVLSRYYRRYQLRGGGSAELNFEPPKTVFLGAVRV